MPSMSLLLATLALVLVGGAAFADGYDFDTKLSELSVDQLNELVSSELSELVRNVQVNYEKQKKSFFLDYKDAHEVTSGRSGLQTRKVRSVQNASFLSLPNRTVLTQKDIDLIENFSASSDFDSFAQLLRSRNKFHLNLTNETTKPAGLFEGTSQLAREISPPFTAATSRTLERLNFSNTKPEASNIGASGVTTENISRNLQRKNMTTLPPFENFQESTVPTSLEPNQSYLAYRSRGQKRLDFLQGKNNNALQKVANIDALERALFSYERDLEKINTFSGFGNSEEFGPSEPWHSYSYNTGLYDREQLEVADVTSVLAVNDRKISKVFQIPVGDALLATDKDNLAVLIDRDGGVASLRPGDGREASSTGCLCPGSASDLSCVCCVAGSCPCEDGRACGLCQEAAAGAPRCTSTDAKVRMDVADAYEERHGTSVIAAAAGGRVALYRTDGSSITALRPVIEQATAISGGIAITGLAVAQMPLLRSGLVLHERFLVTFRAASDAQFVQLIVLDEDKVTYELRGLHMWQVSGKEMKFLQASDRAFVFISNSSSVTAFELTVASNYEVAVKSLGSATTSAAITAWHCFLNLGQPFLIVSDLEKAALFSVIDDKIVETQVLRAADFDFRGKFFDNVLPVDSGNYRGDASLLAASADTVRASVWQPGTHIFRPENKSFSAEISEWTSYGVLQPADATKVIGVTADGSVRVLTIKFSLVLRPDPALKQYNAAGAAVALLQERLEGQQAVLRAVLERLRHSIHSSSSVQGSISIRGTIEAGQVRAETLSYLHAFVAGSGGESVPLSLHQAKLEDERLALNDIHGRLQTLLRRFEDGVEQHSREASIDGHVFFTSLSASLFEASDFSSQGSSLQDVICDLVETRNPLAITGKKVFRAPIRAASLQTTFLATIPMVEFVTRTSDAILENVTYTQGLTILDSFEIAEGFKLGGKTLSNALLTSESAAFDSCSFQEVKAPGTVSSNKREVNGIDLEALNRSVLKDEGYAAVAGSLNFLSDVIVKGDLYSPSVMGVDTGEFFSNVLMKNANERRNFSLRLASPLEISGNLFVNGKVNGHSFPLEYPHKNSYLGIFEEKVFEDLAVENIIVQGTVDGLRTEDLVTLSTNQIVTGHKIFSSGIEVDGDLNVMNFLVDGVDLQVIGTEAGRKKEDRIIYNVVFHDSVVLRSLNLDGMLNNFNFSEVAQDLVLKDDSSAQISGKKLFEGNLAVDRIDTGGINYLPIENFVTNDRPQFISGHKTFVNGLKVSSIRVDGLITELNLTDILTKSLYKNKQGQKVTGSKIFTETLSGSQLFVEETINDVDFNTIATKSGDNVFNGEQTLSVAVFVNLNSSNIVLQSQIINGIDIGVLNSTVLYTDSKQKVLGSITCTGSITFESSVKVERLNNFPLEQFISNLVIESESNWVRSNLSIEQIEVEGNLLTKGKAGMSNVNISKLNDEAIKLDDEILDTDGVWEDVTFLSGVQFDGPVNNRMLSVLLTDSVFRDSTENLNFTGSKTFAGNVEVSGDVTAVRVNDLHLPTEAFTKSTHQLVPGAFEFAAMRVENITFAGPFNGLDVEDLLSTRLVADVELQGPVTFLNDVAAEVVEVDGYVDGVDVVRLLKDLILINDTGIEVTGEKTTFSGSRYHELFIDDLNGENFDGLADDFVKMDEENHFNSSFKIKSVTSPVIVANSVIVHGFVEGEKPDAILNDVIRLNEKEIIRGKMNFENLQIGQRVSETNLSVGSLNGRSPLDDFLLSDIVQSFVADVKLLNLTASDLLVNGFVNGWPLDTFSRSLKHTGGQTIEGEALLLAAVAETLNTSGRCGPAALVDLNDNVVRLDTSSTVQVLGQLKFSEPVEARTLWCSSSVVNGVNVKALAQSAWSTNQDSLVTGNFIFTGPVFFEKDFSFDGHALSTLPTLARQLEDLKGQAQLSINVLKKAYVDECRRGSAFVDVLKQPLSGQSSLGLVTSVVSYSSSVLPLLLQSGKATYLFVPPPRNSCDFTALRWDDDAATFQPWITIRNLGVVTDWIELQGLNSTLVAVAVNEDTSVCANASSLILRVSRNDMEIEQAVRGWNSVSWDAPPGSATLSLESLSAGQGLYRYSVSDEGVAVLPTAPEKSNADVRVWTADLPSSAAWARARDGTFEFGLNSSEFGSVAAQAVAASLAPAGDRSVAVAAVFRGAEGRDLPYVMQIFRLSTSETGFEIQDSLPLRHSARVSLVPTSDPDLLLVVVTDGLSSPHLFWLRGSAKLSPWQRGQRQLETGANATWSGHFSSEGSTFMTILSSENSVSVYKIQLHGTTKLKKAKRIDCPAP